MLKDNLQPTTIEIPMLYDEKIDKIVNLTQHSSTETQAEQGVIEPPDKEYVKSLITFEDIPTLQDLRKRANLLVEICREMNMQFALIAGAHWWLIVLEHHLRIHGITPLQSFSKRVSFEHTNENGTVHMVKTFVHAGWIQSPEFTIKWE